MYISKRLEWLQEYLNLVKPIYTKIKKLTKIKIMKTSYKSRDRAYGLLTEMNDGTFVLSLRDVYQYLEFYPLSVEIKPLSKIDILSTLAHELAHFYHDTHSPEHNILENQIKTIFMLHLKLKGYISEEDELGGIQ